MEVFRQTVAPEVSEWIGRAGTNPGLIPLPKPRTTVEVNPVLRPDDGTTRTTFIQGRWELVLDPGKGTLDILFASALSRLFGTPDLEQKKPTFKQRLKQLDFLCRQEGLVASSFFSPETHLRVVYLVVPWRKIPAVQVNDISSSTVPEYPMVVGAYVLDEAHPDHLKFLCVHPSWRRGIGVKGLGRALLLDFEAYAARNVVGLRASQYGLEALNVRATILFYERQGYKPLWRLVHSWLENDSSDRFSFRNADGEEREPLWLPMVKSREEDALREELKNKELIIEQLLRTAARLTQELNRARAE